MAGIAQDTLRSLSEQGWTEVEDIELGELVELSGRLGTSQSVKRLTARPSSAASGPSLSAMHGLECFPPHTDGANEVSPPRYVAIWSQARHRAATLLWDGEDPVLSCVLFSRAWLTDVGRRHFYAVPRQEYLGRVRWRLNPDCMRPTAEADAVEAAFARFGRMQEIRIEWRPKLAVLFDNSRMLHGREAVAVEDGGRELMRVSIT